MMFDRLDRRIHTGREEMAASLLRLLAIPSVKGDPEPGAPFGRATRDALDAFLNLAEDMGFATHCVDGMAGYVEWGQGEAMVAALGHLDVVPPGEGWSSPPFAPRMDSEGRIIGRGSVDDKGPMIACLYAMKALRDEGVELPARVRLILGLDEESGSSCMERYVKTEELPKMGFTPDADFPAIYAEKGVLHLTLQWEPGASGSTVPQIQMEGGERANMVPARCILRLDNGEETVHVGKPAHGSTPYQGENAIAHAMQAAGAHLEESGADHPFVRFFNRRIGFETDGQSMGIAFRDAPSGDLTMNAGVVHLTESKARLELDIRYPVTDRSDRIRNVLTAAAAPYGIRVVDKMEHAPLHMDPDSPLLRILTGIYQDVTGRDPTPVAIGGGTYARTMPGIVAFGTNLPGEEEMMHKADEYIPLAHLETCACIYARAFHDLAVQAAEEMDS